MTEALVLFFILTSSYFFWRNHEKKSWKCMCASGIFMGLAWNTKYIALVAISTLVFFIMWVERSWRPLIKKNFLIWLSTIFLVTLPLHLTLLLNRANPYWWILDWFSGPSALPQQVVHPFLEIIPRGISTYVYLFARAGSPWLPWLSIYEFTLAVFIPIPVLYHIHSSLKVTFRESYIMFLFLAPALFVIISPLRHSYWLIYSLPYYFIMFSNFTFLCAHPLRISEVRPRNVVKGLKSYSYYLKFFAVVLAFIVIFSNTIIGVMAPVIDKGELEGLRLVMPYIRNRVNDGDSIAGWWGLLIMYYINQYDINVTFLPLEKIPRKMDVTADIRLAEYQFEEQVLLTLKPRFIVIDRLNFDFRFNATMKEEVLTNYQIISFRPTIGYFWGRETVHQICLVLERKSTLGP